MSARNDKPAPSMGLMLTFKDVKYEIPSQSEKGTMLTLLKNISGYFSPGQLSALMGPSGSGKTTLLDILAGRKTQGKISGTVRFAGYPPTSNFLRRYAGYVEQFDTLIDLFTVREMLTYTAELKRPISEPFQSKRAAVDALIEKLGLEECQHVKIGSPLNRGISGGQSKRVNIGIALVAQPRVLFLDEPTSGLDSFMANEVMTVVKNLALDGTTICTTIHAPTPYTYGLFDTMMILIRGETVYFGSRENAVGYFEALTGSGRSGYENSEAEWITEVVVRASKQNGDEMTHTYSASELKQSVDAVVDGSKQDNTSLDAKEYKQLSDKRATVTPIWFAISIFLKYRSLKNFRSPEFMIPRFAAKAVLVFFLTTIFHGIGNDFSASNFVNVAGLLFLWCALPVFSAAAYLPGLVMERAVFYRERSDGLYQPFAYIVAKMIDELILAFISSIIFGSIVFFAADLQGSFAIFWAVYCGNLLVGASLAFFIASVAPNLDAANAMLPAYSSTLILFAGFVIRRDDIPKYYAWYTYIDFVQYGFTALLKNQYDTERASNLKIRVEEDDGTFEEIPILNYYSVEDVDPSFHTAIVYVFFISFFFLAFLAMQFWKHQRR